MDRLPPELVRYICHFLERFSLRPFRLVCKAFAQIGEEQLFHSFEFRLSPNHHKLYLLEQLAATPSIACRLQCLSVESGIQLEYADYRYWHAQVYQEKTRDWERGFQSKGFTKDEYTRFHEQLQARFTNGLPSKYDLVSCTTFLGPCEGRFPDHAHFRHS
jgi:hypothetical protein